VEMNKRRPETAIRRQYPVQDSDRMYDSEGKETKKMKIYIKKRSGCLGSLELSRIFMPLI
jgi:hypothetical protein